MYRLLTITVFVAAAVLRLLLCWVNLPSNSFDDHFEPTMMILQTGSIPAKDACFECYNPPVFYYSSALVARLLEAVGVSQGITKSLMFLNCFYGIATLLVLYLILKRFRLSSLAMLIAFSVACFLPRHIYMSAMYSNDCLAYLAVAVSVYLLLLTLEREMSWKIAALLGTTVVCAIFVKYTAFIAIPMVAVTLAGAAVLNPAVSRRKASVAFCCAVLPPMLLLGSYMFSNQRVYGNALPWNDAVVDTAKVHPRDPEGMSFASFAPWQYLDQPVIVPGQMHSFWTLLYSGAWFDTEPHFTHITDRNFDWWAHYFSWLGGKGSFPVEPSPISQRTRLLAAGLVICGLVPLALALSGMVRCIRLIVARDGGAAVTERLKLLAFPVMLAFNVAGIIFVTLKAPVYSSVKTTYLLDSLPAFGLFLGLGVQGVEASRWLRISVISAVVIIGALASAHVFEIASSLDFARGSG